MIRTRTIGAVAALALAGAGGVAAAGIAGGEGDRATRAVLPTVDAVSDAGVAARVAGPAARGRRVRKPLIQHFYAPNPTVPVNEGEGIVQGLRCPRGFQPIGGAANTAIGIVVGYLSRRNPRTGARPPRTYFVGIEDVSANNLPGSGAIVEVICAKNLKVKG